jgi:myo-inositol-1-phosphate synthase
MGSIRVAIVGVGNCASSLVQGVHYYRDADPTQTVPGLMHVTFGDYHVRDVEFVAAFDVDDKKVGKDLAEAINASENNTIKIADVPTTGVTVQRGTTLDGLGKYYRETIDESAAEPVDVVAALRDAKVDVLVSYLPVGSEKADKFYAQCAIDAGVAFVNALPVFIASDPEWAAKFEEAGVPVIGDDIKSQVGATITHRVMAKLFEDRGVALDRTYQLNVGGNMDFKNMLERERLESKKVSKTQAVTSNLEGSLAGQDPTTRTCTSARRTTSRGSTTASGPTSASRVAPSVTPRSTSSTSSRSGTPRTRPASSSTPSAPRRSPRTAASAAPCCRPRPTS